jgi:hypothetical protein
MPATVNGLPLLTATITETRIGAWTAEIDVDSDVALPSQITIDVDGVQWLGTVLRGDVTSGHAHASVIAGAGTLGTMLDARYYLGASMGTVLADIMRGTGEHLSDDTSSAVRGATRPRWTRSRAMAGQALRQIAAECNVNWRVLRDGTVWLGSEAWPASPVAYTEIDRAPGHGSITIAPDGPPSLAPATMLVGRRVSTVMTRVSAAGVRQTALFDDSQDDSGAARVMRDFEALVESCVGNRIDYSRMYAAKVVSGGAGMVDILADDPSVRGNGITRVPIRHGVPGVTVTVPSGGRVMLFFEDGDPKKPAAALWPDGSSVTALKITAATVTIEGDLNVTGAITSASVAASGEVTAQTSSSPIPLSGHTHPTAAPGAASLPILFVPPPP